MCMREKFIKRLLLIEEKQIDVTEKYEAWFKIGVAISREFGENGLDYFLRISRFYPNYSEKECRKMYFYWLNNCSHYNISMGSFFYYTNFLEND